MVVRRASLLIGGNTKMSRGKQKLPTKQSVSMRLTEDTCDHLKRLGNGNRTKGFNAIYQYYVEHNDPTKEPDQLLTKSVEPHTKVGTPLLVEERMLRNSYISPMPS